MTGRLKKIFAVRRFDSKSKYKQNFKLCKCLPLHHAQHKMTSWVEMPELHH